MYNIFTHMSQNLDWQIMKNKSQYINLMEYSTEMKKSKLLRCNQIDESLKYVI
jgi:hypothetical protein